MIDEMRDFSYMYKLFYVVLTWKILQQLNKFLVAYLGGSS